MLYSCCGHVDTAVLSCCRCVATAVFVAVTSCCGHVFAVTSCHFHLAVPSCHCRNAMRLLLAITSQCYHVAIMRRCRHVFMKHWHNSFDAIHDGISDLLSLRLLRRGNAPGEGAECNSCRSSPHVGRLDTSFEACITSSGGHGCRATK
jgi:hypothetical protein